MSQATTDPTLEALAPRGSAWHGVTVAVVAVLVLVAAWVVPAQARPSVTGTGSSGAGIEFPVEHRELVLVQLAPHGWGGVTVTGIDDVPGAHVLDAWAVTGTGGTLSNPPAPGMASDEYVRQRLGVSSSDHLPRRLVAGRPATLVILWQIDDCRTAATAGAGATPVHLTGLLGTARVETLPVSPMLSPDTWSDGTACRP